jgi:hypothetical protein
MPAVLPRFAAIHAPWLEAGAILARRLEKRAFEILKVASSKNFST